MYNKIINMMEKMGYEGGFAYHDTEDTYTCLMFSLSLRLRADGLRTSFELYFDENDSLFNIACFIYKGGQKISEVEHRFWKKHVGLGRIRRTLYELMGEAFVELVRDVGDEMWRLRSLETRSVNNV